MSVEFEGDYRRPSPGYGTGGINMGGRSQATGITGWFINKGIVKDESGAKVIMLGIVCVNFLLVGFILVRFVL